jgi:hypothetical protein
VKSWNPSAFLDDGVYDPDAVQIQAVADSIAFFDKYLKKSP